MTFKRVKEGMYWLGKTIVEKLIEHLIGVVIVALLALLGSIGAVVIWFKAQGLLLLNWFMGPLTIARWEFLSSLLLLIYILVYVLVRISRLEALSIKHLDSQASSSTSMQVSAPTKISVVDKKLGLVWEVANNQYWHDRAKLDRATIDSYVEGPFDYNCKGFVGSTLGSRGGYGAYLMVSNCKSCGRAIPIRQILAAEGVQFRGELFLDEMKIVVIRALQKYLREGHTLGQEVLLEELPYAHM